MIDSQVINISSGNGGNGCVSGRREKYIPKAVLMGGMEVMEDQDFL